MKLLTRNNRLNPQVWFSKLRPEQSKTRADVTHLLCARIFAQSQGRLYGTQHPRTSSARTSVRPRAKPPMETHSSGIKAAVLLHLCILCWWQLSHTSRSPKDLLAYFIAHMGCNSGWKLSHLTVFLSMSDLLRGHAGDPAWAARWGPPGSPHLQEDVHQEHTQHNQRGHLRQWGPFRAIVTPATQTRTAAFGSHSRVASGL